MKNSTIGILLVLILFVAIAIYSELTSQVTLITSTLKSIFEGIPKSIGVPIGSVATYRFVYVDTYNYPNMTQQPATVSWSFEKISSNGGISAAVNGTCETQIEYFNVPGVTQLNAPTSSGIHPNVPQYGYMNNGTNLAICEISLPTSILSEYNTTVGMMNFTAVGTNGATSGSYYAEVYIQSLYSASQGQQSPILVVIPLTTSSSFTQTSSTTTTSTTTTTTTVNPVSPPISAPNFNFLQNIIDEIQASIRNFVNNILRTLGV